MKKLFILLPVIALLLSISSCSKENVAETADQLSANKFVNPMTFDYTPYLQDRVQTKGNNSTTEVFTDPSSGSVTVDGSSTINRNSNGVTVNFNAQNTPNLDPAGHALTLWCIFINADFVGYSMYRLGGNVVGNNGVINISGHISEGSTNDLWAGSPLEDAENDLAFVIAKSHGPMNPMYMPDQILTFDGGCASDPDGGGPDAPCYEFIAAAHF